MQEFNVSYITYKINTSAKFDDSWYRAILDPYEYDCHKYQMLAWCINYYNKDDFIWTGGLDFYFRNKDDHTLFMLKWVQ